MRTRSSAGKPGNAPPNPEREANAITATYAQTSQQDRETVHLLRGQCQIVQGGTTIRSEKMVIWRRVDAAQARERVTAYLEDNVRVDEPGNTITERTLVLDLVTEAGVTIQAKRPITGQQGASDPTYKRGEARRGKSHKGKGVVRQAQYAPQDGEPEPEIRSIQLKPPTGGIRRLRAFPRAGGALQIDSRRSTNTTPVEQVVDIMGGDRSC